MRATGIIRKCDSLGRVVIPKELRRTLKIKEETPLEIFTHNGAICFKPYCPVGAKDWAMACKVLEAILTHGFALVDSYDEIQISKIYEETNFNHKLEIRIDGELIGYLAVNKEDNDTPSMRRELETAMQVLQSLFADVV